MESKFKTILNGGIQMTGVKSTDIAAIDIKNAILSITYLNNKNGS